MTDEPKKIIRKKFKPSDVPNPIIGDLPPVAKKRGANDGPIFSPENQAFLDRLDDKPGDSATLISVTERIQSSIGRARMHKINAGKKIPDEEREQVNQLNEALKDEFPKKTPRYKEIANRLDLTFDQIRYRVEGRR